MRGRAIGRALGAAGVLSAVGLLAVLFAAARGAAAPTTTSCLGCHPSEKLAPAPEVVSQRAWMSKAGKDKGVWKERGIHGAPDVADDSACSACHKASGPPEPVSPPEGGTDDCASCHVDHKWTEKFAYPGTDCASCHAWVQGAVGQTGFTNASGDPEQTTFHGPISPEALLARDATAHSDIFAAKGCAGCHDSRLHGIAPSCVSCHSYRWEDPKNLHLVHIPVITVEQRAADPQGFEERKPACAYCHSPTSEGGVASCWSCHLSGHDPVTPYWEPAWESVAASG